MGNKTTEWVFATGFFSVKSGPDLSKERKKINPRYSWKYGNAGDASGGIWVQDLEVGNYKLG